MKRNYVNTQRNYSELLFAITNKRWNCIYFFVIFTSHLKYSIPPHLFSHMQYCTTITVILAKNGKYFEIGSSNRILKQRKCMLKRKAIDTVA